MKQDESKQKIKEQTKP